ncbi:hypothetical protein ACEWPL_000050 [Roseovarius sp. S1116L3]|uniref:hypothetical protein n=1 Tax=Roseovarius roseus TaxID=3342636 RepID=UPI003729ED65
MAGFFYRDFGTAQAGPEGDIEARLRTEQLRRALQEASGLRAPLEAVRVAAPAVSGQVLEDDDAGGETARVIDTDGDDAASEVPRAGRFRRGARPFRGS